MSSIIDKNSMTYWYPKIESLPIPQPRTEIVKLNAGYFEVIAVCDGNGEAIEAQMDEIQEAVDKIGTPLFLRTSHTSGKHSWIETCYVTDLSKIRRHISALVEDTALKEIPIDALVFRKYIKMASTFTAFRGKMPVSPERRYFIRDGKVECHHPYWIEQAILEGSSECNILFDDNGKITGKEYIPRWIPDNWQELLAKLNAESEAEIKQLSAWAELVATKLEGYWSVDFCMAEDGSWYLIDCALGRHSWHPECQYHV